MNRILRVFSAVLVFAAAIAFLLPGDVLSSSARKRAVHLQDTVSEDDIKAEIQFGREVGARVLGQYPLYENKDLTKYVNLVAASLARNSGRPELAFKVAILKSDSINAYAAPGGFIFVTLGAIGQMKNEAELAAVIAHEMAHITGKHIVKELEIKGTDSSAASGITRMVGGAGDPAKAAFASMVDKALGILFERGYKKEDEREADASGVVFTALSGYDPTAMVSYFDRIKKARGEKMDVINKTHPSFDERIRLIDETIENEGLGGLEYTKGDERFNEYTKAI